MDLNPKARNKCTAAAVTVPVEEMSEMKSEQDEKRSFSKLPAVPKKNTGLFRFEGRLACMVENTGMLEWPRLVNEWNNPPA
ncbi:hypothetical protein JCM12856_20920 [Spirochaeta dissipatitropha]